MNSGQGTLATEDERIEGVLVLFCLVVFLNYVVLGDCRMEGGRRWMRWVNLGCVMRNLQRINKSSKKTN